MQLPRIKSWRWVSAATIATATLGSASGLAPAWADEPRTLCGKTLDEWVGAVRDRSSPDRWRAVSALGCFGPDARVAVPDLVDLLRDELEDRSASRSVVINALAGIGPDAAPAVSLLAKEFRKEECFHGKGGAIGFIPFSGPKYALVQIGAASVPELIKALEGRDEDRRPCCAVETLGEIGPPASAAVPALVRALRWQQPKLDDYQDIEAQALRKAAVIALGRIGPAAEPAIPALNALLERQTGAMDPDHLEIVIALDKIGAPPVAKLIGAFPREGIADELACLGTRAREAIPTLRRAISSDLRCVRHDAARALAAIDPSATDAIPILIEALDHPSDEVGGIPEALARFGPAARPAIPSLVAQIKPDGTARGSIRALVQIDPEGRQCVPALIAALKQTEPDVVFAASEGLGLLGPRARAAVPALTAVVGGELAGRDSNDNPRVSALKALVRIDRESPLVIVALTGALRCQKIEGPVEGEKFDDWSVAEAAAKRLGALGPLAKTAVPTLIHLLRNRGTDHLPYTTIEASSLALGQIGPDARAAIPVLRDVVGDRTGYSAWAMIALDQRAADGRELAEGWLKGSLNGREGPVIGHHELEGRAMLFGAIGRTSLEADAIIHAELAWLDNVLEGADREGDHVVPEWIIERLGRFGVGSRLAIPRLYQLRRHRDPWIRMWARETLVSMMRVGASN